MEILPAIDLRAGQCVRLLQGDYARQIDYNDNPVAQAQIFQEQGARWLHVVDLDGALAGNMQNGNVIRQIAAATDLNLEVGGGIRSEDTVRELLEQGIARIVVGTRALEDRKWFLELIHRYPGKIVLGLDARQGRIATRGWTETGSTTIEEMAKLANKWPLAAIVFTDIARDGMLTGANLENTRHLAEHCRIPIIASGGVGSLDDIRALSALPLMGIIVGRALYEGRFSLKDALAIISAQT